MFGLFNKKKEAPAPQSAPDTQGEAIRAFASQFPEGELDILAITGSGFAAEKQEDTGLWEMDIPLIAWLDDNAPGVFTDPAAHLVALLDDQLCDYLRRRIPAEFILKFTGRPSEDGRRILMCQLPQPGFDPELKAMLEKIKAPVTVDGGELGTFTWVRSMNWFQTEAEWGEEDTLLTFPREEDAQACLSAARQLLEGQEDWDGKLRELVCEQLLEQLQQLEGEGEGEWESDEPITREELYGQLFPDTVQVHADGAVEFWFGEGGLFLGRTIRVTGTLHDGPTQAVLEE